MRLPRVITDALYRRACKIMAERHPDFVIGDISENGSYLKRWWVIPRNRVFNIYLHRVTRSDDDRALHDHPWANASLILDGGYYEHTIEKGGINKREWLSAGDIKLRSGKAAHRLEIAPHTTGATTFFFTGPNYRSWGFHCPDAGWVHWKLFTDPLNKGNVGKGCAQ
jgi:hypothetical protein